MWKSCRAATVILLITAAAVHAAGQESHPLLPHWTQDDSQGPNDARPDAKPTVTVFGRLEVQRVLGKEVRSETDEDMGRIVDVIVDQAGQVRAAIIDFGGFLGVGNHRVAVAFPPNAKDPKKGGHIGLDLNREQVLAAAPEYKEGKPVVVLGASGGLESLPFP